MHTLALHVQIAWTVYRGVAYGGYHDIVGGADAVNTGGVLNHNQP
jgi:hypothetical protein